MVVEQNMGGKRKACDEVEQFEVETAAVERRSRKSSTMESSRSEKKDKHT